MSTKKSDLTKHEQDILVQKARELKNIAKRKANRIDIADKMRKEIAELFNIQQSTLNYLANRLDLTRSQVMTLVVAENKI